MSPPRSRRGSRGLAGDRLRTSVGSLCLANPVMTAAGTAGHGAELSSYFDISDLGAVVVKSLAVFPWQGNPSPRVCPVPGGMLNSVGLQGPGLDAWAKDELPQLRRAGARVVVSIWGRTVADFSAAAAFVAEVAAEPEGATIAALEANVSCPNVKDRSRMFAHSASATADVIGGCCEGVSGALPVWAKLSPNTSELLEIAGAAVSAGAASLTLVNTVLGLMIDTAKRRPSLGAGGGGLSGAAMHAVALRAVHDCRSAFPKAGIVGVGGVSDGEGALRMLMAGANALQVGTATLADPRAPVRVLEELSLRLAEEGFSSVDDAVGAALVVS